MTEKKLYEYVMIELRKTKAPSLQLEDFLYWSNKGIQEYINERYLTYETTQQLSDDLQALSVSTSLSLIPTANGFLGTYTGDYSLTNIIVTTGKKYGSDFIRFSAPQNYWHFLGSHVTMVSKKPFKCFPAGSESNKPSKRLTKEIANGIIDNAFLKPSFERPYHSFSDSSTGLVYPDLFYYFGDAKKFGIKTIYIDYLKEPKPITLNVTQRDLPIDTSETLEFPEFVCREIIKRITKLILEVNADPRLNTNPIVTKTIP